MSDFKINTGETLISWFNIKQFAFECFHGEKKEENQKLFQQAIMYMPVVEIDKGIYYRARKIEDSDGENTGIIRNNNGIPISGYNVSYSGVAPKEAIKKNGRINRIGEQVLYLAKDIETSCKEQKPKENEYISVAECTLDKNIKLMDFTVTVVNGLDSIFLKDTIQFFKKQYAVDIQAFYIFLQDYLTSPEYKNLDYIVPLNFLDIVKQRNDISGIKYNSYYTKNYNIALWDKNKNSKCINPKVIKYKINS